MQFVVCGAGGCFFEPGHNRSFDMKTILQSHFGGGSVPSGSAAFNGSHQRVQLPHCVFSCYWGVETMPVIVAVSHGLT